MSRDYHINGESLVRVKGATGTTIASLSEFGLTTDPVILSPDFKHDDIPVDAWGKGVPEIQFMLAAVTVSMNLIHYDRAVLDECLRLSMGGATTAGLLPRAGTRMGGGVAIGAAGNNFVSLYIASPVDGKPWFFPAAYIMTPPMRIPLGTEKTIWAVQWRVVPYTVDPWNSGNGASGVKLYDNTTTT